MRARKWEASLCCSVSPNSQNHKHINAPQPNQNYAQDYNTASASVAPELPTETLAVFFVEDADWSADYANSPHLRPVACLQTQEAGGERVQEIGTSRY